MSIALKWNWRHTNLKGEIVLLGILNLMKLLFLIVIVEFKNKFNI